MSRLLPLPQLCTVIRDQAATREGSQGQVPGGVCTQAPEGHSGLEKCPGLRPSGTPKLAPEERPESQGKSQR